MKRCRPWCALIFSLTMFAIAPARDELTLQQQIDRVIARGETRFVIPPGEHRLPAGLRLRNLKNFTLEAASADAPATLIFTNLRDGGIFATDCDGLTLRGFTIDFDPLAFTQGTVESIDPKKREITFALHDGYPDLAPHFLTGRAHLFDPATLLWKTTAPDIYATSARALSPRRGILQFAANPAKNEEFNAFAVGDYIALDFRHARGIRVERARDLRIDNLTLHSIPSIAVICRFMEGDNVFNYKILPGPPPPGATLPRLLSSSADGLNYAYARTGPVIENCDFSRMGDDSVNLHGIAFYVASSSNDNRTLHLLRPYGPEAFPSVIRPGDEVRGLASDSFDVKGRSTLAAFRAEAAPPPGARELAASVWKSVAVPSGKLTSYRLDLDNPLPLSTGDFVEIPAIAAPGYIIRNNRFTQHRARALRLMSSHGIVEDNTIEDIKQSAITIGPEFTFAREAGWVEDVVIRHNTLRRVALDPALQRPSAYTPGAISVFHRGEMPSAPLPAMRHKNIRIEQNTLTHTGGPGIHVNQAQNVRIVGNTLSDTNLNTRPSASSLYKLTTGQPVAVDNSTDVTLSEP
ncbi:alpha-1,2-mannosidase [Opitutaceae bacterium TAV5]|nr:alpha-1,2-mannosidase [Opitutaceae bacterium TAV5]